MRPIFHAEDRSLAVPAGCYVVTGYVAVDALRLGSRARMAVGDVDLAYQRRLQLGSDQPWPCPRGEWEGEPFASRFVVIDGRHDAVAAMMLGQDFVLCAWPAPVEAPPAPPEPRRLPQEAQQPRPEPDWLALQRQFHQGRPL